MGSQTPIFAIPYPVGTDRVADGDDAMRSLAQRVEDRVGGALVAQNFPAAQTDVPQAGATVLTVNVAFKAGHRYKVSCTIQCTAISVAAAQALMRVSLAGPEIARPLNIYGTVVNNVYYGTSVTHYAPPADATSPVVVAGLTTTSGAAIRLGPNSCSLIVEDLGAF